MVYDRADLARRLAADEFLKLGEVAALAGVPRTTLNDWLRAGRVQMRHRKTLGGPLREGQRRFNPDDVRKLIADATREHGDPAADPPSS